MAGDFADHLPDRGDRHVAAATEADPALPALRLLAALRGREAELLRGDSDGVQPQPKPRARDAAAARAHWTAAVRRTASAITQKQLAAARAGQGRQPNLFVSAWALPELVEAAVRTGGTEVAAAALEQLAERTHAGGTDFGLGLEARCRALVSRGQAAEACYCEAIDRLSRAGMRAELARAHLVYGEWLRRGDRRLDAREQLRTAHDMLTAIGMEAFAERARRELVATGEAVRKRGAEIVTMLTPQEACIARLARDGMTNPEIGAQLFLSARTVEWHLRKIFTKLGISSRRELTAALARHGQDGQPA